MEDKDALVLYSIAHPEFFETFDRHEPSKELIGLVEGVCGSEWTIEPSGFWTHCRPRKHRGIGQGWKIHISGTDTTASELLCRLAPIFAGTRTAFKFCSDSTMVRLSISKNWPRTGAGKFITVYPESTEKFIQVIEECYLATKGFSGPYILTDRQYKDSQVVFYRYGGHRGDFKVDELGRRIFLIVSPDGQSVVDKRSPFLYRPEWERDPFGEPEIRSEKDSDRSAIGLKDGRYEIDGALKFSSLGGIYTGIDTTTGQEVIIREGRPGLRYSHRILRKEARILQKLGPFGVAPSLIDTFEEGGHLFVVQERLRADSLWTYAMGFTVAAPHRTTPQALLTDIQTTVCNIIDALKLVHAQGIVLRDFTKTNVLIASDAGRETVKFIDFEFSFEVDGPEPPVPGFTIGYASPQQLMNQAPETSDDYYALGSLILDMIAFNAAGLELNRSGVLAAFRQMLCDFSLPKALADVVEWLTNSNPDSRCHPDMVSKIVKEAEVSKPAVFKERSLLTGPDGPVERLPVATLKRELTETIEGITSYILANADYARSDRLWPASAQVFLSCPVGIRFGASGPAFYLSRATGNVPEEVINWILLHVVPSKVPMGLYSGLSGVALLFLSIGLRQQALEMLAIANDADSRVPDESTFGLYDGSSGRGLVNLRVWMESGDKTYLSHAECIADKIISAATSCPQGAFWRVGDHVPLGLGYGSSGIGIFLLYLYLATSDLRYLHTAQDAILYDISQSKWLGERVFHHTHRDAPTLSPKSPHMRHGSGGVGTAAIRLYAVTKDDRLLPFITNCIETVSTRFTNKLWQDWGLAGFGEMLLDAFIFLKDNKYLNDAYYLAEGILPYQIKKPEGIAFPGNELIKISCDFGLGAAGIGVFLHRLCTPETPRLLFLDDLIIKRTTVVAHKTREIENQDGAVSSNLSTLDK